jgi:hypothetical protein
MLRYFEHKKSFSRELWEGEVEKPTIIFSNSSFPNGSGLNFQAITRNEFSIDRGFQKDKHRRIFALSIDVGFPTSQFAVSGTEDSCSPSTQTSPAINKQRNAVIFHLR